LCHRIYYTGFDYWIHMVIFMIENLWIKLFANSTVLLWFSLGYLRPSILVCKGKNILILVHKVLGYFYSEKIMSSNFKSLQPQEWIILIFFKHIFFLPNMHHSFWKLKRNLTLMIRRAKGLELMNFFLQPIWAHLAQMCFWHWKFWILKMWFNKKSYVCDRGHECIIYMI
jgi:hypothetical protein